MDVTIHLGDLLSDRTGTLRLPRMTDQEFYDFCRRNETLNIERNAEGDILLMPPSDAWTDSRGSELLTDLSLWNRTQGEPGYVFGSAAGFRFSGVGERAPDAAWVAKERWDAVPPAQRHPFPPLAPDFVAEVMSPSDSLTEARRKMDEYLASGVRLAWLIDRKRRRVYVYRPGLTPQEMDDPATVSGDPELLGFVADMARVFLKDTGE